ncbi:maestro heat-like repeat family member 5 [Pelodiscus sinensis]|uniref:maestro heat-like repeat family member 5 n=1 Tax=Pelodiscus sinensis TaxID=13735 RepID=UPI003F6C1A28
MVEHQTPQLPAVLREAIAVMQSQEEQPQRNIALTFCTEFLRSPSILTTVTRSELQEQLMEWTKDPNPEIRRLCLQGLGSIIFQPEKGQLLRAQLPGTIAMFCARNAWTVLEALKDAADASYLLAGEGLGSISQDMAVGLRPLIDHRTAARSAACPEILPKDLEIILDESVSQSSFIEEEYDLLDKTEEDPKRKHC